MEQIRTERTRDPWLAARRGLALKCPSCGKGRILAGYLKPQKRCPNCSADFSTISADDGPAWATILLVGHIASPMFLLFASAKVQSVFMLGLILSVFVGLTLAILPRMKGLFIALIWANRADGRDKTADTDAAAAETAAI
ncbi:MAG: DUF983 domain-containing protein [Hyphomonadaceae bacterium]